MGRACWCRRNRRRGRGDRTRAGRRLWHESPVLRSAAGRTAQALSSRRPERRGGGSRHRQYVVLTAWPVSMSACRKANSGGKDETHGRRLVDVRVLLLVLCLLLVGCGTSPTSGSASSRELDVSRRRDVIRTLRAAGNRTRATVSDTSPRPSRRRRGPSSREQKGTTIITADSQFGPMLYDASGQAIYLFDARAEHPPGVLRGVRGRLAAGADQGEAAGEGTDRNSTSSARPVAATVPPRSPTPGTRCTSTPTRGSTRSSATTSRDSAAPGWSSSPTETQRPQGRPDPSTVTRAPERPSGCQDGGTAELTEPGAIGPQ